MVNGYTTRQVAIILRVSTGRVRQLALELKDVKKQSGVLIFSIVHIQKMAKRNTKPGPKGKKR